MTWAERTQGMDEEARLRFEANVLNSLRESEGWQFLKFLIQSVIGYAVHALLDERVTKHEKLLVNSAEARALKRVIVMVENYSEKYEDYKRRIEMEKEAMEADVGQDASPRVESFVATV